MTNCPVVQTATERELDTLEDEDSSLSRAPSGEIVAGALVFFERQQGQF